MEKMNQEFETYWENHYENKVMTVALKKELKKVAYNAFAYAYKKAQEDFSENKED